MKKKLTGIIAAVAALALGASLLAGCGGSGSGSSASSSEAGVRTVEDIQADGKIVIGVFSDKNPFGDVDENGEYQGYDIELARQLATDLGVDVEFVSTEAANRVEYLKTNKVDLILANFTVTEERAEAVDFCEPYMHVALGAVSHKSHVITSLDDVKDEQVIVISGTTAETYLTANYPNIKQQKFDTYAAAKTAFENDANALWLNDNTEVIAFANGDPNEYVVGIESLGNPDTIAPAVAKGNENLLTWINEDMVKLGAQNFFHAAYEKTLLDTYGAAYEDTLVVEPGQA